MIFGFRLFRCAKYVIGKEKKCRRKNKFFSTPLSKGKKERKKKRNNPYLSILGYIPSYASAIQFISFDYN